MTDRTVAPYSRLDDPELTLALVMQVWPETITVFIRRRMHCVGCPIRRFHTIEDACRVYGLARSEFLAELSLAIARTKASR